VKSTRQYNQVKAKKTDKAITTKKSLRPIGTVCKLVAMTTEATGCYQRTITSSHLK